MNDELDRMQKEKVVAYIKVLFQHYHSGTEVVIVVSGMRFEPGTNDYTETFAIGGT